MVIHVGELINMKMGCYEAALVQSKRAIQIAASVNDAEICWRRVDYAKILLQTGHYREAMEECTACLSLSYRPLERLTFMLTGVQALLGLHRLEEAADWLQQADAIIEADPLANDRRTLADALRQRL
jgi:tetratricopeptide (TPR) repeat protein